MSLLNAITRSIGFSNGWSQSVLDASEGSVMPVFDARIMNIAIAQSGGEATDSANLGTVHYTYDDMNKNDGLVTLPYG